MTTKNQLVEDILCDKSLAQPIIKKFINAAEEIVKSSNVANNYETWNMDAVLIAAGIAKVSWTKESYMSVALWVLFFAITGENYPTAQLKYQNVKSFLEAYEGFFNDMEPMEQETLKNEANWFKLVSVLLPPNKNKGLSIQIVPRLVEGWYAKYVTGSGQTDATKRRVHIFEKEGGVIPSGRSGGRTSSSTQKKKPAKAARKTKPAASAKTATIAKSPSLKATSATGRVYKHKIEATTATTTEPYSTGTERRYHTRGKGYHRGSSDAGKSLSITAL